MDILERSSHGITQVSCDAKLLSKRMIFIEGEIKDETAREFVKKIMLLNFEDSEAPIHVLINSYGGSTSAGWLIYDVIQGNKAPIKTYCIGKAYSMGAVLFACGNHGRYMLPHSKLMLHEPLITNGITGNSSSVQSISESLLEEKDKINKILAKHTARSEEEVAKATSYEHYLSAAESKEFGLCDEIVGFDKIMEE